MIDAQIKKKIPFQYVNCQIELEEGVEVVGVPQFSVKHHLPW